VDSPFDFTGSAGAEIVATPAPIRQSRSPIGSAETSIHSELTG
jgi:hypothetical protein